MEYLTESELQIMKCIWEADEQLALSEILRRTNERYNKGWKPQTASTFVSRLVQKGFLRLNRSVRYYSYEVLIREEDYLEREIQDFADFWGDSVSVKFIGSLVRKNRISGDDREELVNILQKGAEAGQD